MTNKSGFLSVAALLLALTLTGCSSSNSGMVEVREVMADQRYAPRVPGAVEEIWEEPMVDVIDVPPGLDPEGHYYRPGHQEVVEIRQGRWRYYRD